MLLEPVRMRQVRRHNRRLGLVNDLRERRRQRRRRHAVEVHDGPSLARDCGVAPVPKPGTSQAVQSKVTPVLLAVPAAMAWLECQLGRAWHPRRPSYGDPAPAAHVRFADVVLQPIAALQLPLPNPVVVVSASNLLRRHRKRGIKLVEPKMGCWVNRHGDHPERRAKGV